MRVVASKASRGGVGATHNPVVATRPGESRSLIPGENLNSCERAAVRSGCFLLFCTPVEASRLAFSTGVRLHSSSSSSSRSPPRTLRASSITFRCRDEMIHLGLFREEILPICSGASATLARFNSLCRCPSSFDTCNGTARVSAAARAWRRSGVGENSGGDSSCCSMYGFTPRAYASSLARFGIEGLH